VLAQIAPGLPGGDRQVPQGQQVRRLQAAPPLSAPQGLPTISQAPGADSHGLIVQPQGFAQLLLPASGLLQGGRRLDLQHLLGSGFPMGIAGHDGQHLVEFQNTSGVGIHGRDWFAAEKAPPAL
jgi:hypothetical protein